MKRFVPIEDGFNPQPPKKETPVDELTRIHNYSFHKERFHHIDRGSLLPGVEVNFSIFIHKGLDFDEVLDVSDKSPQKISPEIFDMKGDIVIKTADIPFYGQYLESLGDIDLHEKDKVRLQALIIKEKSKLVMREVLSNPRSGASIKKSSSAVEEIAASIFDNKDTLHDLISIKNYDYYTYTHSVNVAVLSIGIGIAIGLPAGEISNLGFGAMLHDIGKSSISPEILNKPDKLTSIEFNIMQNHVMEGERILKEHEYFPENSFYAVTQHHEKLSGKGYPLGIKAPAIKLYGKITAIADCYDALTTQRPYKSAFTPFNALNIVVKETEDYDQELLKTFIKMLGRIGQ